MAKKEKVPTEGKVIAAAVQEFADYGYDGARVDRIAVRAKINKAMIYYHFKSKEALYERILKDLLNGIYSYVANVVPKDASPLDALYAILDNYMNYINALDRNYIRIVLREISSGGTYFRKIGIPVLVAPMMKLVFEIVGRAKEAGQIRDIVPHYTMLQVVGGIVFFNLLKTTLKGSDLYDLVFHENYLPEFKENFMGILRHGIEKREDPS
jgi:TetR/AcrR family transcriptional regulator